MKSMNAQTHSPLESRDLLVIYALVKGGTLEAAARLLQRDVSSVFRAIKRIEKQQGQTLFNRSNTGYAPLAITQVLAERGEQIHEAIAASNHLLRNTDICLRGRLKITSTDLLIQHFLLPCVSAFCAQHRQVSIEFDSRNDAAQLWERDIDLALRPTNQPPETMIGHHLATLNYAVVGCSQTADAPEKRRTWLVPAGAIRRHWSRLWIDNHKRADDQCLGFDSMAALVNALHAGFGLAVVPTLANITQGTQGYPQYAPNETTQLWLLYHPNNASNPLLKAFLQHCFTHAQACL